LKSVGRPEPRGRPIREKKLTERRKDHGTSFIGSGRMMGPEETGYLACPRKIENRP